MKVDIIARFKNYEPLSTGAFSPDWVKNSFILFGETLDTGEATFEWYVEKNKYALKEKIKSIDQYLGFIRNKGRQPFTEVLPENLTRIIRGYSEPKKDL